MCGDLPETTAFKSYAAKQERRIQYANYSDLPGVSFLRLTHSEASEGYPTIVKQHSALPKTMPTDAASPCWSENWQHHTFTATREVWPISAHAHWCSKQDVCCIGAEGLAL